jgi:hypothetical protein
MDNPGETLKQLAFGNFINGYDMFNNAVHGNFEQVAYDAGGELFDNTAALATEGFGYGFVSLKTAVGPLKQWVRIGPSYSHNMGLKTTRSIRWGASPANGGKYIQQIGSMSLRTFNQYLRSKKLPGSNWRVKDPGHFHLKK